MTTSEHLSPHFLLSELTDSAAAAKLGLDNTPSPAQVELLRRLCTEVLEPWRARIGPIKITSGYRSPPVNAAVGGSKTSDHMDADAADAKALDVSQELAWAVLLELIRDEGLPVRQAILYPGAQIHVAYGTTPSRHGQLLVKDESAPRGFRPWREP